jgi:hypothetical protein
MAIFVRYASGWIKVPDPNPEILTISTYGRQKRIRTEWYGVKVGYQGGLEWSRGGPVLTKTDQPHGAGHADLIGVNQHEVPVEVRQTVLDEIQAEADQVQAECKRVLLLAKIAVGERK